MDRNGGPGRKSVPPSRPGGQRAGGRFTTAEKTERNARRVAKLLTHGRLRLPTQNRAQDRRQGWENGPQLRRAWQAAAEMLAGRLTIYVSIAAAVSAIAPSLAVASQTLLAR